MKSLIDIVSSFVTSSGPVTIDQIIDEVLKQYAGCSNRKDAEAVTFRELYELLRDDVIERFDAAEPVRYCVMGKGTADRGGFAYSIIDKAIDRPPEVIKHVSRCGRCNGFHADDEACVEGSFHAAPEPVEHPSFCDHCGSYHEGLDCR